MAARFACWDRQLPGLAALLLSTLLLAACGGGGGGDGPRVLAQAQSLRFDAAPTLVVDASATLHAQASSGLAPRYSSLTAEVCRIDAASGEVTGLRSGNCSIAADQAGNADWAVAPQVTLTIAVAGRQQALWFDTAAAALSAGDTLAVRASAESALAVRFASASAEVCRIDAASGQLEALGAGTCLIEARQAGDTRWAAATPATLSLVVSARTQAITLDAAPALAVGDSAPLGGSASSGLALHWLSTTPAVCRIDADSGQVTALAAGSCSIEASQAGNTAWAAAVNATLALPIKRRTQALSVQAPDTLAAGGSATLRASASSGLTPRITSLTPTVCGVSVDGSSGAVATVSASIAGRCELSIEQDGDARWAPAEARRVVLSAQLQSQSISLGAPPALSVGGEAVLSASASSGLGLGFASLTPAVCAIDGASGRVTALAAGTCSVAVQQAGNAAWAAALTALQSFVIDQRSQAIRFAAAPALRVGGSATASALATSGLAVRYASATPSICSVAADSGALLGLAEGECQITADQAGDATYAAAAQATLRLNVAPDPSQSIRFGDAPSLTVAGTALASASASSGLAVRFASLTPAICTVDATSGLVSGLALGTCTLSAEQAGDARWQAAATVTLSFPVATMTQFLAFGAAPALTVGGSAAVSATASSGLAVRYASLSAGICSVQAASGLVSAVAAGTCTIAAYQDGGGAWAAALPATLAFVVDQRAQSLSFAPAPTLSAAGSATVSASASSGLAARYASLTPAVCRVNAGSGRVAGVTAGSCVISADQDGDVQYAPALTITLRLEVSLATQSLVFGSAPALTVGASASVAAVASSGLAVGYASLTPNACGIDASSGLVSGLAAGTCSIVATQPGNATWAAAETATQAFTVQRQSQSLAFGAAPSLVSGSSGSVLATASSGLAVSYASLTPAVCTVDAASGVVSTLAVGTCTLQASQSGNASVAAATSITLSLTVAVNPVQTLRFDAAPTLTLGTSATLRAVASSGLAPSYSSLTPTVCSVGSGSGVVTALTLGDCSIAADQAGSGLIQPAAQVRLSLTVQRPAGVTAPGVPVGVSATLGNGIGAVLVSATSVPDGGHAISGYTAVSSPGGWRGSAATLPVTVSCATSCAGETFTLYASNGVGAGSSSAATPVLTTFDILSTFHEPDTQPRDSIFTGSFTLNSSTGEITNLSGRLTESMSGNAVGTAPYYDMTQVPLVHQLASWRDATLGGTFVASFAKNTTRTFTNLAGGDGWSPQAGVDNGGVYAGFPAAYGSSVQNSYILVFVPDNPFAALTPAQIAKLAYADCAPGGMMGAVCMTATSVAGYGAIGTMSGYPVSQVITRR